VSLSTYRQLFQKWWPGAGLTVLAQDLGIIQQAVEHPAPTAGARVACSTTTAITTTSDVDITGATTTFTPNVDMSIMVWANFLVDCSVFGSGVDAFSGALVVNGTAQDGRVVTTTRAVDDARSISGSWIVALKSGTAYTVKLVAKTSNAGTNFNVLSVNTWFTYASFPNLFVVP
jgi:hypothetical protein